VGGESGPLEDQHLTDLAEALTVLRALETTGSRLLDDHPALSRHLYVGWFHAHEEHTRRYPTAGEFAAATALGERYRPGWALVAMGTGGVLARSAGGAEVALAMGDVAPVRPLERPRAGAPLQALDRTVWASDGFWHLWSPGWRAQPPPVIDRLYLAVATGAETAVARGLAATAPLDGTWYAKFLTGEQPAGRRDPAVLYLPAGATDAAWVVRFLDGVVADLTDPPARLTTALAPGVGLARDPGAGRSFGQAVCDAIAAVASDGRLPGMAELAASVAPLLSSAPGSRAVPTPTAPDPTATSAVPAVAVALASSAADPPATPVEPDTHRAVTVDQEALEAGIDLAESLADRALWDGGLCAFQGATSAPVPGAPAHWRVFGGAYYDGSAGVARLLAHAAVLGASATVRRTARGAIEHALLRAEGWSLHTGRLGAGLVALELAGLLEDPDLAHRGSEVCRDAVLRAVAAPPPAALDLTAGLAGVLHAVSHLASERASSWLPFAERLAARIASAGSERPAGRSWPMIEGEPMELCGLGHGAAGVALALEDLAVGADHLDAAASATRDAEPGPDSRRWRVAAAAARRFERAHLDPVACSWADLRVDPAHPDASPGHPHFWCHGSVGVGHERVRAHRRHPDEPLIAADIFTALTAARREAERIVGGPAGPGAGFEANASQCHGLSGLIDLLVASGDRADLALARQVAAFVRRDAARAEGPRCGLPTGEPTPGLMLGVAGIAWGQLRAATPSRVPVAWTPAAGGDDP
jgi:lantibiotic biosynthesis protein